MKSTTNKVVVTGLISGLVNGIVFASIMAAFDYFEGEEINWSKFLFQFLFFGAMMGLMTSYSTKKRLNKDKE